MRSTFANVPSPFRASPATMACVSTSRADLEAFLNRPWERLRRAKDAWVGRSAGDDAEPLLALASSLRAHGAELGLDVGDSALDDVVSLKKRLADVNRRLSRAR